MAFSDARSAARVAVEYASGGVVRALCAVRLLVLVLGVVDAIASRDPLLPLIALLAAPFSFVPAINWDTRGPRYFHNGVLLSADVLITVFVVLMLTGSPLTAVYGAATVALWGAASGPRLALFMSAPVALLLVPWDAFPTSWVSMVTSAAAACGVVGMAWAGSALGSSLRQQRQTALALAAERERRAASQERLRIARDLHDTVAGDLAGIRLLVAGVSRRVAVDAVDDRTVDLVTALEQATVTAHAHTRLALTELRSLSIDLPTEIRELAERWEARTETRVVLMIADDVEAVGAAVASDVVAVTQELLENVRKHAEATRVLLTVSRSDDGRMILVVQDDGCGMPREAVRDGHYGVRGISERVAARGGTARWSDAPGGGTRVEIELDTRVVEGQGTR